MQSAPLVPEAVASADVLRVYVSDGRVLELEHDTRVAGDSLIGYAERPDTSRRNPTGRTAIALDDIVRLEERRIDGSRTYSAVGGALIGIALIGCSVDGTESGSGCPF